MRLKEWIIIPIDFTFKICIFGDKSVGKSSLALRYVSDKFSPDIGRTMGADISMKTINFEGNTIALQLWDFNGEERFKTLLPVYARGSAGGILMYDITNKESLERDYDWLIIFRTSVVDGTMNIPIILVGAKLDLYEKRAVSFDNASRFGQIHKLIDYIECSSKTGQNVDLVFNILVNNILKSRGFIN